MCAHAGFMNDLWIDIAKEDPDDITIQMSTALGTELDIAGIFLYKAMKQFCSIHTFELTSEVFMFLYFASVGIERLQKVLLVLSEQPKNKNGYDKFCKTLKTHNHTKLQEKISGYNNKLLLSDYVSGFFNLLDEFYYDLRYERFSAETKGKQELHMLKIFLYENEECVLQPPYVENFYEVVEFIGKLLADISRTYYNSISEICLKNNLYTIELCGDSPSVGVFLDKTHSSLHHIIMREEIATKELLLYLTKNNKSSETLNIEPLDFDVETINNTYITEVAKDYPMMLVEEVRVLYDEMKKKGIDIKQRIKRLSNLY